MKLAVNLILSGGMLTLCLWLVWPDEEAQGNLSRAFTELDMGRFWPHFALYMCLLAFTHFCRAWRWNNLLGPIGVHLSPLRLLAISSVGFMAILALPARLGEFVRPALIRKRGEVSAAAALGTVAVERIVDGLIVSLFVFGAFFALRGPEAPSWMMPTAYAALGVFAVALTFLVFALRWPKPTVRFCVAMTLTPKLAPRIAEVLEEKILSMISGFLVLKDKRNLFIFVLWSLTYWGTNGMGVWVLAQGFGLDLSILGAYATMGLVAVGITLPNSPGLVGQFQWFMVLGLSLYMPASVAESDGLAFAIVIHGIQVVWYLSIGGLALLSPYVSFSEVVASRSVSEHEEDA